MNVRIIDGLKQLVNILYCINVQRLVYAIFKNRIKHKGTIKDSTLYKRLFCRKNRNII